MQFIAILLAVLGLSAISARRGLSVGSVNFVLKVFSVLFPVAFVVAVAAVAISVEDSQLAIAGLLICAGLTVCYAMASRRIANPAFLAWLIAAVIIVDVAIHRENRYLIPAFSEVAVPFSEQSAKDYRARGDHYRALLLPRGFGDTPVVANSGMLLGIPNINAYNPLTHTRWRNFIRAMIEPDIFDSIIASSILGWFYGDLTPALLKKLSVDDRILGLASLRYRYSKEGNAINDYALPRAYAVHHYLKTTNEEESLALVKGNIATLNELVVLENAHPSYSPQDAGAVPGRGGNESVVITRYTPNEIELSVNVAQPSMVILTDAFYPGWVAYVDGRETPIFRANSLFRSVEVPAGEHSVLYRFRPISFYLGAVITVFTIAFVLVLGGVLYRRRS